MPLTRRAINLDANLAPLPVPFESTSSKGLVSADAMNARSKTCRSTVAQGTPRTWVSMGARSRKLLRCIPWPGSSSRGFSRWRSRARALPRQWRCIACRHVTRRQACTPIMIRQNTPMTTRAVSWLHREAMMVATPLVQLPVQKNMRLPTHRATTDTPSRAAAFVPRAARALACLQRHSWPPRPSPRSSSSHFCLLPPPTF